jgi:DNA-binding response OmpR family regulator
MKHIKQNSTDNIFIVEDDEETRGLLHEYLVENGCLVSSVGDGKGVWRMLADWGPDVIILDLMLPG